MEIKTGVQNYDLGGKVTVSFNPTDLHFAGKVKDGIDACIAREEAFQNFVAKTEDVGKMFLEAENADKDIEGIVNGVFGVDVVAPLCEGISVRAWADGMPIWANILLAIMDVLEAGQSEAMKASKARIAKYTKKYGK